MPQKRDYVLLEGSVLPAPELRFNGPDQQDDTFYLQSAITETDRVISQLGYTPESLLVDIGCGQGRLAIGLARRWPAARYLGLDVSRRSLAWCQKHLHARHPSCEFRYIDLINARYNPDGGALSAGFHLPVGDGAAALVYMWAVVTNMEPEHLEVYAHEISRILRPEGRLFLTANVERQVPEVSINPENYMPFRCRGPLHVVRYQLQYFLGLFDRAGLISTRIDYHRAGNCQSDLYFVKRQKA